MICAVAVRWRSPVTQAFVAVGRPRTEPFQRGRIKDVAARIHFWIAIAVEVGERDHAIAKSGAVGNVQQSTINGVGTDALVVAVHEDSALKGAIGPRITPDGVWAVGKIDGVWNSERMLQAEIQSAINIDFATAIIVAIVFGHHNVSHTIAVNVADQDGRIGCNVVVGTGTEQADIPRVAFDGLVAIGFNDVVWEFSLSL